MSCIERSEIKPSRKYSFHVTGSPVEYLDAISIHIKTSLPDIKEAVYNPQAHSRLVNQDWKKFPLNKTGVLQHNSLFTTFTYQHYQIGSSYCKTGLTLVDRGRPKLSDNCILFETPSSTCCGNMVLELTTNQSKNQACADLNIEGKPGKVISEVISFLNEKIKSGSITNLLEILDPKNHC